MTTSVIPQSWAVPSHFRQRLGRRAGRQRAMSAEGHLLLILHAVPKPAPASPDHRLYWRAPDGSWKASPTGGKKPLTSHLEEYEQAIEKLEKRLTGTERATTFFEILREIGPIARACANMRLALQAAREACPADSEIITHRDQAEEVERLADLIQAEARDGLDYALARRSEEQTRLGNRMAASAHRLNLLAALFFPLATLSSVFGMNLHHGLETLDSGSFPWPLLAVLAAGLLLGLIITLIVNASPGSSE
jgi:hypothetical protein